MSAKTERWKNAERRAVKVLQKYKIPAERIMDRSGNFAISTYDARINGLHEAKIDIKYSIKNFKTSTMLDIVRDKYCEFPNDFPVMMCVGYKENNFKTTIDADIFAMLLSFWMGCSTKEELWSIFTSKSSKDTSDE